MRETDIDPPTGIYNRSTMLSVLFRETDRVQRQNVPLCVILLDIDDFRHWNSRLGVEVCDDLLEQIVARTRGLLRSYDLLGRMGSDEFLIALPGCSEESTLALAERLRLEVFTVPFHAAGQSVRLSACFGIAPSLGRAPVVVLREVEQALERAKNSGPESIEWASACRSISSRPVAFHSPSSDDDLLAW